MKHRVEKQHAVNTFLELTAIDNPSFQERAMADALEARLSRLNIPWEEDKSYQKTGGTAGNIYAVLEGEEGLSPVLFAAHMDSVNVAVGKKAIVQEEKGIITSDGTTVLGADDLAGVTAILEALEYMVVNQIPHRTIEILFTYAEEPVTVGSAAFDYSKIRSREAYVLDGPETTGTCFYKAPTICWFDAHIKGKAAHVAFPEGSVNAIKIAAAAISRIQTGRPDPGTSVNIGKISGGNGVNIVPEQAVVSGEVRNYNHEKAKALTRSIEQIFQEEAGKYGGEVQFDVRIGCRAYEQDLNRPVAKRYQDFCRKHGYRFEALACFGGSDNNTFAEHGIEGIVLPIGDARAHSTEEYLNIQTMLETIEAVIDLSGVE